MYVVIGNKRVHVDPTKSVGKGGEADVFRIGQGVVLKIYKTPDHPDIVGMLDAYERERAARDAETKILLHQTKLRDIPKNLPERFISPMDLAMDDVQRQWIVGYTMPFINGALDLIQFSYKDPTANARKFGISDKYVIGSFLDLHRSLTEAHQIGFVIGDFNDLNVLVKGGQAFLLDVDSGQFGRYMCTVFTAGFVDPMLCTVNHSGDGIILNKPHNGFSDWYAFAVMLMNSLLFVGPYDGVFAPKDRTKRVAHDLRPLHRITVFDEVNVRYPKTARPMNVLPDALLTYLDDVFNKDRRVEFPREILERLQFDKGGSLLTTVKPVVAPAIVKEVQMGTVTATMMFSTSGRIVCVAHQEGRLRYLYHQDGEYRREDGQVVMSGDYNPHIRYRIQSRNTVIAKGAMAFLFKPDQSKESFSVETFGAQLPLVDANDQGIFFIDNGVLKKSGVFGLQFAERVGDVLSQQTLFWVGSRFGFGFYRAGNLSRFFLFYCDREGVNDSVRLPPIQGKLIDATCQFGAETVWFFTCSRESGRTVNRCRVIDAKGGVIASAEATNGDGSWLGNIRGKMVVGSMLLGPTDDGIVRVEPKGQMLLVTSEFPDSARFVDAGSQLFPGDKGVAVVGPQAIWNIQIHRS